MYNFNMRTPVLLVGRGLFQDGLTRMLGAERPDISVIGFAETWQEARDLLNRLRPAALIADYQYADAIMADLEKLPLAESRLFKTLFIILDENKMVVYQRQQFTDITIQHVIEAL